MQIPTAILERRKIPRIIFSIQPQGPSHPQKILALMQKMYEMGVWYFDLPSSKHLESFKKLRELIGDETLTGLGHLNVEWGVSFLARPIHQFESKMISTIVRNIVPPDLVQRLFPNHSFREVFTQKEIDRITFDPSRFEKALSIFNIKESPFLLVGEKYSDWLLGLGRIDLMKEMISRIREKGFIPIFSGQWATFILPKAKPLDVVAFAIPINKTRSLFDLTQAYNMIKKYEKPIISLNPLGGGELLRKAEEAFSFLFDELKIYSAISEVSSEDEVKKILEVLKDIPSLIPFPKT